MASSDRSNDLAGKPRPKVTEHTDGAEGLLERGRSSWYLRDGGFVLVWRRCSCSSRAHPRGPAKHWWRLRIEHCPSCGRVALVRLERDKAFAKDWPEPKAMEADGVAALLEIAEIDLPG